MTLPRVPLPPLRERPVATYQPAWQRFQTDLLQVPKGAAKEQAAAAAATAAGPVPPVHPYNRQYAHVYHQRLAVLGPRCWQAIDTTTDTTAAHKAPRILELQEGVLSACVGTVVVERPADATLLHPQSNCTAADTLYLEDASGRVALQLQRDEQHFYCTGMVLGVIGTVGVDGVLQVDSWHAPVPAPASNTASTTSTATTTSTAAPHLLLVSGLQCGGAEVSSLPREMLLSYLEGRTPAHSAATVCRVIIAGASVGTSTSSSSSSISSSSTSSDNDSKAAAVKELDGFLVQLAGAGVPVDILPGANDPTTANWPQRPLHRSLFQQTARFLSSLVSRTPNPYAAAHDGQYVLGTDGANVQDLTRHLLTTTTTSTTTTETSDKTPQVPVTELQALQRTLQVGHICPTGPDSVPTIPHPREDPMVITTQPGIYFAGNCSKFDTSLVATNQSSGTDQEATTMNSSSSRSRLVCLPKFCDTGEVVLVNLETLGVEILQFQE